MLPPLEGKVKKIEPIATTLSNITPSVVKSKKYRRCRKGNTRNRKTHRCNKKCPEGYKRNASGRCRKKE